MGSSRLLIDALTRASAWARPHVQRQKVCHVSLTHCCRVVELEELNVFKNILDFWWKFRLKFVSYPVFTPHQYCIGAHVIQHVIIRSQVDVSNTQYPLWWHMATSKHAVARFTQPETDDYTSNDRSVSREQIISIHQKIFRNMQRFIRASGLKFFVLMFDESSPS